MGSCLPRFAKFFILACGALCAHCVTAGPESLPEGLASGSDFVLTAARFEERRDGRTLWRGVGEQGRGDPAHMEVTHLQLERVVQNAGEAAWTLHAPGARMDFEKGTGRFTPVRLVDKSGHIIDAAYGVYDEATAAVDVFAPVTLQSPSMRALARGAHIDLRRNEVAVEGPVEGSFTAAAFAL